MSFEALKTPLSYRQEIAAPLFRLIQAKESCVVVSIAGMGKSRFAHFVLQDQVRQNYLGDQASRTLLVMIDSNRLAENSDWAFYELLLTALIEASGRYLTSAVLRTELNGLRRELILARNEVLGRRYVELAVHLLSHEQGFSLCLLFDEFDELYRSLPAQALANLRSLRDMHKYRLSYVLFLRSHPSHLRSTHEVDSFYKLFSRWALGLGPHTTADAELVISELQWRLQKQISTKAQAQAILLSGGHPGLLVALFHAITTEAITHRDDWLGWAIIQPAILDECYRLWASLTEDEQLALTQVVLGKSIEPEQQSKLTLNCTLKTVKEKATMSREDVFSPLFAEYVALYGIVSEASLRVDETARLAWVGERPIRNLTAREFDLLTLLYRNLGQVYTRDQILSYLYPGELHEVQDNALDTLVKRVREKIEPVRERPRFLVTVRGVGYKLVRP